MRLKRPLPSSQDLKSLRLVRRPSGWYADLTYAVQKEALAPCNYAVGIDLGVNNRLALSTGEMVPGPQPPVCGTPAAGHRPLQEG